MLFVLGDRRAPAAVVGIVLGCIPLRDAWAWFGSSMAERDAYRKELDDAFQLHALNRHAGFGYSHRFEWKRWHAGVSAIAVVGGGCLIAVAHAFALLPLVMIGAAILVAMSLDLIRRRFRRIAR